MNIVVAEASYHLLEILIKEVYVKEVPYFNVRYHKIPKISPGAYIFQRPLLRGLFLEGLI